MNFLKVVIATATILLGSSNTKADDRTDSITTMKHELIDNYMKSAFARGDELIRPAGIPQIAFYCPGEFCNSLLIKLKSDFPSYVKKTETPTENTDSEILILFYPSLAALEKGKVKYRGPPGSEFEFLNSGDCRLGRYKLGPKVIKVFVFVAIQASDKASEACVLTEVMRGSGLEFRDRYEEYSKRLAKVSDQEFEINMVLGTVNMIKLHWTAPTISGMNSNAVREILNRFVKSAHH